MPFASVEIDQRLARSAWGHGYVTEAARAALKFGFGDLALSEIAGSHMAWTSPSGSRRARTSSAATWWPGQLQSAVVVVPVTAAASGISSSVSLPVHGDPQQRAVSRRQAAAGVSGPRVTRGSPATLRVPTR